MPTTPPSAADLIGDALPAVQDEILSVISTVVPVAIAILAAVIGITFGLRFVRQMVGRR